MATHSSILAWGVPWTEEPGRLQSTGSQRVRHDWAHRQTHTTHSRGSHPLSLTLEKTAKDSGSPSRAGLQGYRWVGKSGLLLLGDGFPVVRMTAEKRNKWRQLTLPSQGREQKPREPLSFMSKGLTGPQKSLSFFSKSEFENCRSRIAGPITQKIPDPGHPWSRWSFHRKS